MRSNFELSAIQFDLHVGHVPRPAKLEHTMELSQLFNRGISSVAFSSRFRAIFELVALKTARKRLGNVTDSPK